MARQKFDVDLTSAQPPADYRQKKLATLFSSSPGENVQPYAYWLKNVVPTARGFKSISYSPLNNVPAYDESVDQPRPPIYITAPTDTLYTVPIYSVNGVLYYYKIQDQSWLEVGLAASSPHQPSLAYVSGNTYLFQQELGLLKYDGQSFAAVTLGWGDGVTPPNMDDMIGIVATNGYLVLYTVDTVYWSSPIDPENFALTDGTGVTTGAGSTRVQALQGELVILRSIAGGVILYSNKNMLSMRYTNNASNPWIFSELPEGSGVTSSDHVTSSILRGYHFVWSTTGLAQVTLTGATRILPEWTSRLSTEQLSLTDGTDVITVAGTNQLRISMAAGNFLIISVGKRDTPYRMAWTYDVDLNRWGRFEIDHWAVAPYVPLTSSEVVTYEEMQLQGWLYSDLYAVPIASLLGSTQSLSAFAQELMFVRADNVRVRCDLASDSNGADSLMLVGDIRLSRTRACTIQEIELQVDSMSPIVSVSTDKRDYLPYILNPTLDGVYQQRCTGNRHVVAVEGDFTISAMELTLQNAGAAL